MSRELLPLYLGWLASWSALTFATYGWDKLRAVRGGHRVPERRLHLLALAGGAAGAWLGMVVFRHKRRKRPFRIVVAAAAAMQSAVAVAIAAGLVRL